MESTSPGGAGMGTLLVLEPKSLREFGTKDEYLFAMKEDLAEWFTALYQIDISADNFFEVLETGVVLCRHANEVQHFAKERRAKGCCLEMKSYFVRQVPEGEVQFRKDVRPQTFQARDNVSNFISWCVQLGVPDVLRFETDDLVLRKNEKSVILCLLEIARVGAKLGMLAPTIVQMEEEIDEEIATGEPPPQIKTCDMKSLDEMVRELVGRCTCPIQFPMIKVGEGKYKIGDTKTLIFVRILRNHVMVRVGGGWDTLEHYLDKHDPCRCHYMGHRHSSGQISNLSASQKVPTRRAGTPTHRPTTPSHVNSAHELKLSRKMSSPAVVSSPLFSSTPMRSKSPGPGSRKLPVPQQTVAQQRSRTPQPNCQNTSHWRSRSPVPSRLRTPSPGPSGSRTLPGPTKSEGPPSPAKRSSSPAHLRKQTLSCARSLGSGLNKTTPNLPRKHSMEAIGTSMDTDDADAASSSQINMDSINTMTLEEFKNLLNSALSVPANGAASQSSESPRSQSSSDSLKNQTSSRKLSSSTDFGKSPSWSSLREKVRSVYKSVETSVNSRTNRGSINDSGYLSQNGDRSKRVLPDSPDERPKTPHSLCLTRPKTPTSLSGTRPKTPTSNDRPKTPTSIQRPKASTFWQRPKTPTSVRPKTPTASDEALVVSPKDNHPRPQEPKQRPSTPTMIPRSSIIPRPSTPVSRLVTNDDSTENASTVAASSGEHASRVSVPQQSERPSTPGSGRRQPAIPRPSTPGNKDKTYTALFNARRAATSGPGSGTKSILCGSQQRRSVTPVSREAWKSSTSDVKDSGKSTAFGLGQRSRSVVDVSRSLRLTTREISLSEDEEELANIEERSRTKTKTVNVSDRRQRASSAEPRKLIRQAAVDESSSFMIARTKSGQHCVTLKESGETTYNSAQKNNTSVARNGSTDKAVSGRSRQRVRTPDPATFRQRPRSVEPRILMQKKESAPNGENKTVSRTNSGQHVKNRTEAWVDSTVAATEGKRKLPPRPKRSMTPNSLDMNELELASRPFEEIKAALQLPINGIKINPENLDAPPEDPKAYIKMEKLFEKYREMELRASVNDTPGGGAIGASSTNTKEKATKQGILKSSESLNSRSASSRSLNSVTFNTPSLSSVSSSNSRSLSTSSTNSVKCNNSPAQSIGLSTPKSRSSYSSPVFNAYGVSTSTPKENGVTSLIGDDDSSEGSVPDNNATALATRMQQTLKVHPRKDDLTGSKSKIPVPQMGRNQRSKSLTNLAIMGTDRFSVTPMTSVQLGRNVSYTVVNAEESDDVAELSQIANRSENSVLDAIRSETPVPRMATPLTTGRNTFINNRKDRGPKLVRAMSQDPNLSNSLSSLSSNLSLSTTDNDHEFV